MKTAISIPDDVFEEAEMLAARMKKSRSEVYSRAIREYVARHSADKVTEALDELLSAEGTEGDDFARVAARHTFERSEW
jgi:predicted transcriptional regulator